MKSYIQMYSPKRKIFQKIPCKKIKHILYISYSPVVFYKCKTWSLTLREEHRLKLCENNVLRSIFGPNMDEMVGSWRKMHNEELHNLYSSPNTCIMRMIKSRG
jgi:hypothetical protein